MSAENNLYIRQITFFKLMKNQFPDAEITKIETTLFLEASKEIVELVVKLGKLFAPVKYDMTTNINKIYLVFEKDKIQNKYLHDLILSEKENNENLATNALQWLRRALHFILLFFENIVEMYKNQTVVENMAKILFIAYQDSLMPYHRWLTQQLFHILCKISLSRRDFFKILANYKNIDDQIIVADIEDFLINLRKCVLDLSSFYINNELESNDRV